MKLQNLIPKNILTEEKRSYGCVMLFFDFPEMSTLHNIIKPQDILHKEDDDSFGLEDEPHTTLLYGLHDEVSLQDVTEILDEYAYSTCMASNISLFENEEFDVLKFDVTGEYLHETNGDLQTLPHTSTYPDYHPHLTIGYLKPGKGKQYVKEIGNVEYWLAPQYAVFSQPDDTKTKININID